MYAEEGATGLGLYVAINLYLSHCEGGWGVYNGRQLSVIAIEGHRHRSDVKRVVEDYGLFVIEGSRFTSLWMQQQYGKVAARLRQGCDTPARTYNSRAEDIEIDIEKEKQKKCVCLDDTHDSFSDSPQPLRPQSEFETVRDGRRYASHGQPLPDDAPPQRHRNWFWTEAWYDAHVASKRSGHKAKEQKMKKNRDYRTKRDNGFAEGCNFAASKGSKGSVRRYLR